MPKLVCVYCSSSRDLDSHYYAAGEAVGRGLAERGWGLIYGGGNAGTMGAVARATKAAGGPVVGIIPEFMKDRELAYHEADELVTVDSMRERKRIMAERADAFITLPGGIGTLEEVSEIMVERGLALHAKPLVLMNQEGYYDGLLAFLDRMIADRFKSAGFKNLVGVANTVDEIWPLLNEPAAFEADQLWQPLQ
ncbi:MAG: hypothetical protein SynsKO_15830 [Synoicihabitans sp.]